MSRILAKILSCYRSPNKTKVVKDSSLFPTQADNFGEEMASAVCELPADNAVGQTSLFASVEVTHRDEWLGEKYLEYALAHMLLRHRSGSNGVTLLNVCYRLSCTAIFVTRLTMVLGVPNPGARPFSLRQVL
jgi:hypothetical protein